MKLSATNVTCIVCLVCKLASEYMPCCNLSRWTEMNVWPENECSKRRWEFILYFSSGPFLFEFVLLKWVLDRYDALGLFEMGVSIDVNSEELELGSF